MVIVLQRLAFCTTLTSSLTSLTLKSSHSVPSSLLPWAAQDRGQVPAHRCDTVSVWVTSPSQPRSAPIQVNEPSLSVLPPSLCKTSGIPRGGEHILQLCVLFALPQYLGEGPALPKERNPRRESQLEQKSPFAEKWGSWWGGVGSRQCQPCPARGRVLQAVVS